MHSLVLSITFATIDTPWLDRRCCISLGTDSLQVTLAKDHNAVVVQKSVSPTTKLESWFRCKFFGDDALLGQGLGNGARWRSCTVARCYYRTSLTVSSVDVILLLQAFWIETFVHFCCSFCWRRVLHGSSVTSNLLLQYLWGKALIKYDVKIQRD